MFQAVCEMVCVLRVVLVRGKIGPLRQVYMLTQGHKQREHGLYWVEQELAQASHRHNTAGIRRMADIWDTGKALKMWKNVAPWEIVKRDSAWGLSRQRWSSAPDSGDPVCQGPL